MAKKQAKEVIMIGSKTRDAIKAHGCNMAGDFVEGLSNRAHELVEDAVARAKANNRKTVRASDL